MVRRRGSGVVPPGTVDVGASTQIPTRPPLRAVKVAGERLLLVRRADGRVVAFPDACPHLGQPLRRAELDGTVLICRHHRHRFDLDGGACVWPGRDLDGPLDLREAGEVDGRVWVRPGPAPSAGTESDPGRVPGSDPGHTP